MQDSEGIHMRLLSQSIASTRPGPGSSLRHTSF
jgi:hypothetical protein